MAKAYTKEEAQKQLDLRNGNTLIINFNGIRRPSLLQCKKCGKTWEAAIYSLYDVNTSSKGCPYCNLALRTTHPHNFVLLKYEEGLHYYECKKCKQVTISKHILNYTRRCQYCSKVDRHFYKLKKLLSNELQAYYIIGFLIADGYFAPNSRLALQLQKQDKCLIEKIVQYLELDENVIFEYEKSVGFCVQDHYTINILRQKYNITNNKTVIPCDFAYVEDDNEFLALLIGYIDGDGSIKRRSDSQNYCINIHCHKNWLDVLDALSQRVYKLAGIEKYSHALLTKSNNELYSNVYFWNQRVLNLLINFIENNSLFVPNRKWDKLRTKGGGAHE